MSTKKEYKYIKFKFDANHIQIATGRSDSGLVTKRRVNLNKRKRKP